MGMIDNAERRDVAEGIRIYAKISEEDAYQFIRGYYPNDLAEMIDRPKAKA